MALNWLDNKGCSIEKQQFTWKELAPKPISKLDDDAFTRVRIILMNGIELDSLRMKHLASRLFGEHRLLMAQLRRVEHHQATMINWLIGADHSPLDTTIAYEQVAIEVTAALAQQEPDPYIAQTMRFGLLEDFDHLYRYSALMDRLEGKDPNNITQCYTDILAGRPTAIEHRAPQDDLRRPYDATTAAPLTKLHSVILTGSEYQTHDYYMNIGPLFADPVARQLYAEIASIEEQHVTQYGSLIDPTQTLLEQWLMHEAAEVYMYHSCVESESNPRIKAIWQRCLDYELGHLHAVRDQFRREADRDPEELLPAEFPDALAFESQRDFVAETLANEVDMRACGTEYVDIGGESEATRRYREHMNSEGSPSETVASNYRWTPGTEVLNKAA
jgi:hypothetical protein